MINYIQLDHKLYDPSLAGSRYVITLMTGITHVNCYELTVNSAAHNRFQRSLNALPNTSFLMDKANWANIM